MNTTSSSTHPPDQERLQDLADLTRDIRISAPDRLALRFSLWVLLRNERRAQRGAERNARAVRALARDGFAATQREADLVRAIVSQQYR
nr:hypothetical protein [Microbacterium bovistercoris]